MTNVILVLAVVLGVSALLLTWVKPGKSAASIRILGIVGALIPALWVSVVAIVWAVAEFIMEQPAAKKGKK